MNALTTPKFQLRVFLEEQSGQWFLDWLLFEQEWDGVLWFRIDHGLRCLWLRLLQHWHTDRNIADGGICVAGGRLDDFIPLPLVHCIVSQNVNIIIGVYGTFIEYDVALDSN